MGIPKRRTLWLGVALLLAVVVGAWLPVPRSRITQENFELIQGGMSEEQVIVILGDAEHNYGSLPQDIPHWGGSRLRLWRDGPNWIVVFFDEDGKVIDDYKHIHSATVSETLEGTPRRARRSSA